MVRPNEKLSDTSPEPRYELTILQFGCAGVQMGVMMGILKMYERYIAVEVLNGRTFMSLCDFINQLIVRGLCEYSRQIEPIEKEMDAVFAKAAGDIAKSKEQKSK